MPTYLQGSRQKSLKHLLQNDGAFATSLFLGVVNHYGQELFSWSPSTILMEIEEDFAVKMPQGCYDRLMAAITIYSTDMFQNDLPTFIHICNVLAGSPITEDFDPANVLEMTWALTESGLIDLDPGENHELCDDIKNYIVAACQEEGIVTPPPIIAKLTAGNLPVSGSDFSAEPDLYQATWYNQRTAVIDIQLTVQRNLWKLYEQLKSLELGGHINKQLADMQNRTSANIHELREQEAELIDG